MRNVHLITEYVVLFGNPRDKSQCGTGNFKTLVDVTLRPYSHLLVYLKPHMPDSLRYKSISLQLDRQMVYVIGAVPI